MSAVGQHVQCLAIHWLEVVEPRYHELFELVQEELREAGLEEQIAAGYVLTGGTAKMEGVVEFAEEVFQMPVRVANPTGLVGLKEYVNDPTYATVVGLLRYGMQATDADENDKKLGEGVSVKGLWDKLSAWFKGEF